MYYINHYCQTMYLTVHKKHTSMCDRWTVCMIYAHVCTISHIVCNYRTLLYCNVHIGMYVDAMYDSFVL